MIGAVETGDMIERVGLRDRRADEAAMEEIRAADRCSVGLRRGIRLASVESALAIGLETDTDSCGML